MHTIFFSKSFRAALLGVIFLTGILANPVLGGNRFRTDPDIVGKVVDFDTGQPLPGAVVMALWTTDVFRLTIEPTEAYHDYFEILSDENGEFKIPGKGLILIRNINKPRIDIFKSGYAILHLGDLSPRHLSLSPFGKNVERVNGKVIISLQKKNMAERKKSITERRGVPFYQMARAEVPAEKYRLYTEEIRKEYAALGSVPPWERDYRVLRVVEGGVYPGGEEAVKPVK